MSTIEMSELSPDPTTAKYVVYLRSYDFNMREHVKRVLMMVGELSESAASDIMRKTNSCGVPQVVGIWEKDIAEQVYAGMKKGGLAVGILPIEPGVPEGTTTHTVGLRFGLELGSRGGRLVRFTVDWG